MKQFMSQKDVASRLDLLLSYILQNKDMNLILYAFIKYYDAFISANCYVISSFVDLRLSIADAQLYVFRSLSFEKLCSNSNIQHTVIILLRDMSDDLLETRSASL